jgi:polysaccharide chain length determinant protein (PEP-CTERM system associated)
LAIFVESSLGDKRQDSRSAVKFIDDQIKRYMDTLQASESRLKDFRLKYLGVAGRDGQDYFARLSTLSTDIDGAKLELESATESRDSYKRELAGETATDLLGDEEIRAKETLPEVDNRISALKKELDDLLRKYTDQHPDVIATKRLIDQLQQQRTTELEARRKAAGGAPSKTERNPVFQQLKISLADAEATVAGARAKLAGYQSQYQQLKAQARLVPEVEAEYVQLTRDYDVQKKTYESLLARREAAGMGMDVQDTGGAQFRVIDPPRVTPEPVAPTRWMLLGLAFVASLFAGFLASFVASEVRPIFHDSRSLREVTKRPILGMVSMLQTEAQMRMRRRSAYLFAGGLSAFLALFTVVSVLAQLFARTV